MMSSLITSGLIWGLKVLPLYKNYNLFQISKVLPMSIVNTSATGIFT